MGKRGPQKTPTDVLAQRGSWLAKRPERQNEAKVEPTPIIPACPEWVSPAGREHWQSVAHEIHACGLMTRVDVQTVGMLCDALAEYVKLRDSEDNGERCVYTSTGDARRNPIWQAVRDARADVIRLIRECGMSPASRAGMVLVQPEAKKGEVKKFGGGFAT